MIELAKESFCTVVKLIVVKALNKISYKGYCSIEFEKDMKDALPGIAESVGYFSGVMKTIDQ